MAKQFPPFGGLAGSADPFPPVDPDAVAVPIQSSMPVSDQSKVHRMDVTGTPPSLELILARLGPIGQNIATADPTKIHDVILQHENTLFQFLLLLQQLKTLYSQKSIQ